MLKAEIEHGFVKALINAGVTHNEMEEIVATPERARTYAKQLLPHVKLCVKQARHTPVSAEPVNAG